MAKITDTPYTFAQRDSAAAAGDMTTLGWDLYPLSVEGDHEIWYTRFTEGLQPLHSWLDAVQMVNDMLSFDTKYVNGHLSQDLKYIPPEELQALYPFIPEPAKDDTLFTVKKIRQMRNALRSLYPNLVLEKLSDNINCSKRMMFDMLRARWFRADEESILLGNPPFVQIAGTSIQDNVNVYMIDFNDDCGPRAVVYMSSDPTPPSELIAQWKEEDNLPGGSSINPVVVSYQPLDRGQDLQPGPDETIVTVTEETGQLFEVINGEIVGVGDPVVVVIKGIDGGESDGGGGETPQ